MNLFQIISSIVIPLIAIITAIIAYQQYYINKVKLRHDLYEQRANVYRAINKYLKMVLRIQFTYADLAEFWGQIAEAEFIFDSSVVGYIDEIYQKGLDVANINDQLYGELKIDDHIEKKKLMKSRSDHVKWFSTQSEKSKTLFRPYLLLNESVTINPKNKGYKRMLIVFGVCASIYWVCFYSITIFKLDYLFNNKYLMYSLGVFLSFFVPYSIYRITFWIILGFKEK